MLIRIGKTIKKNLSLHGKDVYPGPRHSFRIYFTQKIYTIFPNPDIILNPLNLKI